jgi:hypothetical protein
MLRILFAIALFSAACSAPQDGSVSIQTDAHLDRVCLLIPVQGVLVPDETWGLALQGVDGSGNPHRFGVVWPHGYSARREHGVISLIAANGDVVAREGERLVLDALRDRDPLYPCRPVERETDPV